MTDAGSLTLTERVAQGMAYERDLVERQGGRRYVGGRTREIAARRLGLPETTYGRVKKLIQMTHDGDLDESVRETARTALADIDTTGVINGAYERAQLALAASRNTGSGQTPAQQRKMIEKAVLALSGLVHGLDQIEGFPSDMTPEESSRWVEQFSQARRTISIFNRRLKEHTDSVKTNDPTDSIR